MEFYNFEKYNDVFCFKKLSQDYQPLLKIYESNYKTSLNTFLKEYEENTEFRYIESQLYICNKEITIQKSIITSLERLDHETFYYVRNRISETHLVYLEKLDFQGDETDEVDETELCIHATAKNFIKFISNRITSLCSINEFLGQRKQQIENELTTNIKDTLAAHPVTLDLSKTSGVEQTLFTNKFDSVKESRIVEYFKENLVDKKYITEQVLNEYLKTAFEKKEKPKQRFSFDKNPTQGQIKKVFYNYYKVVAGKPYGKQQQYVELLGDYFSGFNTQNLITNFSK